MQTTAMLEHDTQTSGLVTPGVMKANVFRSPGQFGIEEKPIPLAGPGEVIVKVRLTTICGTDIHIIHGEYPVQPGLTIGHEAVGIIHEIGPGVVGYQVGQRVLVGAITPCGIANVTMTSIEQETGVNHPLESVADQMAQLVRKRINHLGVPSVVARDALSS